MIAVKLITIEDAPVWDSYVYSHPRATLYHLSSWKDIIENAYGHKTYYLMATEDCLKQEAENKNHSDRKRYYPNPSLRKTVGILPLVHLKHFIFGDSLISIPFFDLGGILANDEYVERLLVSEAMRLGQKLKVDTIELRQGEPLSWLNLTSFDQLAYNLHLAASNCSFQVRSHKVRMILDLPESSDLLMKSFKSKLRSQVLKSMKDGLTARIGHIDQLEQFYHIFAINMRDLGSPVHSKKLMLNVLSTFPAKSKIVIIYKDGNPLACSLMIDFQGALKNPWASALRKYSRLSPNMLLYWTMLEYACNNGLTSFDFGRSSPNEGTYKFKEQWGAQPSSLHWYYLHLNCKREGNSQQEKSSYAQFIEVWKKIPVPLSKVIGPPIRKHIGL
ncbi:MAG: GNAT family N-acetyltransferase [Nitrospirota bacterium]